MNRSRRAEGLALGLACTLLLLLSGCGAAPNPASPSRPHWASHPIKGTPLPTPSAPSVSTKQVVSGYLTALGSMDYRQPKTYYAVNQYLSPGLQTQLARQERTAVQQLIANHVVKHVDSLVIESLTSPKSVDTVSFDTQLSLSGTINGQSAQTQIRSRISVARVDGVYRIVSIQLEK